MPYILKEVRQDGKTGYKVCKKQNPARCFSNDPLPKERAVKQRTAIILSEMGRSRPAAAMPAAKQAMQAKPSAKKPTKKP
jgi:hypothetical protein